MELELNWKNGIDPNPGKWQSRESTGMFGNLMAIYYIMLKFIQNHSRFVMLMKTCMISLKASTFNVLETLCENVYLFGYPNLLVVTQIYRTIMMMMMMVMMMMNMIMLVLVVMMMMMMMIMMMQWWWWRWGWWGWWRIWWWYSPSAHVLNFPEPIAESNKDAHALKLSNSIIPSPCT